MTSGPTSIAYSLLTGNTARARFDAMADLYSVVYAEPPYEEGPDEVAGFAEGLPEEAVRPGFTAVLASTDRALAGAVYGWTMPAGGWWSQAGEEPPDDIRAVDKLAIMEWMVRPEWRGQGIGAELMRLLLKDRPETWATLASDPRSAARGMYQRAGWRQVGTSALPWGPPMHLLALPLR